MDQNSLNAGSSDTESLPYSMTDSDTGSLVESIGSLEIESRDTTPKDGVVYRRKDKKPGPHFLQFSKELPDVSVSVAWEYIRDHRSLAKFARRNGVLAYFEYLEGDGAAGSVYVSKFSLKFCEQLSLFTDTRDERYLIHKVELRDDNSHMYAARCVGGSYLKRYHLYLMFIKVITHEVLGEGSSSIVWRLQYEVRDPSMPPPLETKIFYMTVLDILKDQPVHRVQRPTISHAMSATMTKRLKVLRCRQARQQHTGCHSQNLEGPSPPSSSIVENIEEDDQKRPSSRGNLSSQLLGKGEGEYKDAVTSPRPRMKTRSKSLMKDEEVTDGDSVKRQRLSKSEGLGSS